MSVAQPQNPPPRSPVSDTREITIVSHSTLFYWWPVWAVGFILGVLSYFSGTYMAVVPAGTGALPKADVTVKSTGSEITEKERQVLVLPEGKALDPSDRDNPDPKKIYRHMARSKNYGVLFATVLLLVIVITNVPLRGMWSVMVIVTTIMLVIILSLADLWKDVVNAFTLLDIRINAGGYFFISTVLFILWLITFVFFDKQIYMIFTPGQLKVCTEIGGGEKVYSAIGMNLEKQRSDLFRHWILGLGSGDLVVKTSGAQAHHFDLPNVLFIGKKVHQIEEMIKRQAVVETR
jgi:hypothetical protein